MLVEALPILRELRAEGKQEMATLQQLETLLGGLPAALTKLGADAQAILQKLSDQGNIPDADLQALQTFVDGVNGVSTQIEGVLNPTAGTGNP